MAATVPAGAAELCDTEGAPEAPMLPVPHLPTQKASHTMGNAPIRLEQRKANDEAHQARIANFERSEAAAKARRESEAKPKPTKENDTAATTPAVAQQPE